VPYFASIVPHVVRMEPGLAAVTAPKWFVVKTVGAMPLRQSVVQLPLLSQ